MTETRATNIKWHDGIPLAERFDKLGCRGCTMWFTGLPASGKSTVSTALEAALIARGVHSYRLDGDNIRHGLNKNLGFSREDRAENIRRIGEVAKLFADSACIALTAFISPYVEDRERNRRLHEEAGLPFLEVFVDAPLGVCETRDPKGQYKAARAGKIKGFTGVDDPYEAPPKPELTLRTAELTVEQCVQSCIALLEQRGILRR